MPVRFRHWVTQATLSLDLYLAMLNTAIFTLKDCLLLIYVCDALQMKNYSKWSKMCQKIQYIIPLNSMNFFNYYQNNSVPEPHETL